MKKLLLFSIAMAILASCKKTPDELNVVAQPTTFNQAGTALEGGTFEIASNTSWTASPNAGWVHVSKESGNGNQAITITVDPGTEDRTSSVTVQAGGIVKMVPVSQVFDVFVEMNDEAFRTYCKAFDSNNDGVLRLSEAAVVDRIEAPSKGIISLRGIEYFTGVEILYCGDNTIASLDLRKNTKLTDLHCDRNRLTELNISGCTHLRNLACENNLLTSLDVSTNVALQSLICSENKIISLNVSGCSGLNNLDFGNLHDVSWAATLDISGCRNLSSLSVGMQETTVYVWAEFDTATPSNTIPDISYHGTQTSWVKR